jgi:TraY domain
MVTSDPKRRPGPRPKGPFEDKRRTLTTRITDATRQRLEEARAATGRSLSQEIEFRLDGSFRGEDLTAEFLRRTFGDENSLKFVELLAGIAQMIDQEMGSKGWTRDRPTYDAVRLAWDRFLDARAPLVAVPDDELEYFDRLLSGLQDYRPEERRDIVALFRSLAKDERLPPELRARFAAAVATLGKEPE